MCTMLHPSPSQWLGMCQHFALALEWKLAVEGLKSAVVGAYCHRKIAEK